MLCFYQPQGSSVWHPNWLKTAVSHLGWDPSLAGVIVNDAWGAAELLRVRKNKLNG